MSMTSSRCPAIIRCASSATWCSRPIWATSRRRIFAPATEVWSRASARISTASRSGCCSPHSEHVFTTGRRTGRMAKHRCAVLDDYQSVALNMADWTKVAGDLDGKVFSAPLGGAEEVARALNGFAIVCAMRERTPFPRQLIEALPDLRLLITTGMVNRAIDLEAAKARN